MVVTIQVLDDDLLEGDDARAAAHAGLPAGPRPSSAFTVAPPVVAVWTN